MEISYHGTTASLALLLMFPAAMVLLGSMKPARGATLLVFVAALYGPEGAYYKIPLFPYLTKDNLPYMFLAMAAVVFASGKFFRKMPGLGPELILYLSLFAAIITARDNTDPLTYGGWMTITLPGMDFKDAIAMGLADVLKMAVPFMVGRCLLDSREDLRLMIKAFIGIMLVYNLWIFVELKMSPQMNVWLYGYFAHTEFSQVYRWGGYRPMVFMSHGLALSLLVCHACTILAAARRGGFEFYEKVSTQRLMWGMVVVLVLCKSSGSIFYALVVMPFLLRWSLGASIRLAQVLAVLAVVYPYLRSQDLIPVEDLVNLATNLSAERAQSLEFRFDNEGQLLVKAQEKLWFGWGSYGRNSIYDDEMGREIVIADGAWIILLGIRGVVGMVMEMGVPAYAAFVSAGRIKRIPNEQDQWLLMGVVLMLAIGLFDLIPNGLFNHYPYFVAGAVYGLSGGMTTPQAIRAAKAEAGGVPVEPSGKRKKRKRRRGVPTPPPAVAPNIWSAPLPRPSAHEQDRLFGGSPPSVGEQDQLFGRAASPPPSVDEQDRLFEAPSSPPKRDPAAEDALFEEEPTDPATGIYDGETIRPDAPRRPKARWPKPPEDDPSDT